MKIFFQHLKFVYFVFTYKVIKNTSPSILAGEIIFGFSLFILHIQKCTLVPEEKNNYVGDINYYFARSSLFTFNFRLFSSAPNLKPEKYTSAVSYNNLHQLFGVFCQNISLRKMRNCDSMCLYRTFKKKMQKSNWHYL